MHLRMHQRHLQVVYRYASEEIIGKKFTWKIEFLTLLFYFIFKENSTDVLMAFK